LNSLVFSSYPSPVPLAPVRVTMLKVSALPHCNIISPYPAPLRWRLVHFRSASQCWRVKHFHIAKLQYFILSPFPAPLRSASQCLRVKLFDIAKFKKFILSPFPVPRSPYRSAARHNYPSTLQNIFFFPCCPFRSAPYDKSSLDHSSISAPLRVTLMNNAHEYCKKFPAPLRSAPLRSARVTMMIGTSSPKSQVPKYLWTWDC
jgi:hypothetical protein